QQLKSQPPKKQQLKSQPPRKQQLKSQPQKSRQLRRSNFSQEIFFSIKTARQRAVFYFRSVHSRREHSQTITPSNLASAVAAGRRHAKASVDAIGQA
ncbi:MAG TPA: hypothetical protein PLJ65_00745, partial [Casimicrobium sp.]|nr:hypothetical protein [Casimicrobium sp.]